jgi:hypothetical protein
MTDRSEAPTAKLPPLPRDAAQRPPRRERIRKPDPLGVIAGSFGLFFAITALLAFQMRRGADPALGAPQPQLAAAAPVAVRQVLVRRVIVTRIVEHRPRRGRPSPTRSSTTASATPAAPAAPAAPAPAAPAPAPLTTRSS